MATISAEKISFNADNPSSNAHDPFVSADDPPRGPTQTKTCPDVWETSCFETTAAATHPALAGLRQPYSHPALAVLRQTYSRTKDNNCKRAPLPTRPIPWDRDDTNKQSKFDDCGNFSAKRNWMSQYVDPQKIQNAIPSQIAQWRPVRAAR